MRRIAIVGAKAPHRSENQIASAARRLGLEATVFDALGETRRFGALGAGALAARVMRLDPDLVLCTRHAARLGMHRLERIVAGRRSVLWFFDAVEHDGVADVGARCDVMYTTYANQREFWRSRGVRDVRFLPQALDPDTEHPVPHRRPELTCEVSFVGSGQYPYRWPLLQRLAAMCDLQVRGPGWDGAPSGIPVRGGKVTGMAFAQVIAGAAISLGANAVEAQDSEHASASDRMWKVLGCGGAYVGPWVPGIDAMARDREHCRWYRSADECVAIILELLGNPRERRAMAVRGHEHAMLHHTYDARLRVLLDDGEWPS